MVGFRGSGLGFGEGGKKGESLTWSRGFARSGLCCYRVEKEVAELAAEREWGGTANVAAGGFVWDYLWDWIAGDGLNLFLE